MADEKTALQELEALEQANAEARARIKLAAAKSGPEGYTLQLSSPIMVGAEKRIALTFRPQTVRDLREVEAEKAQAKAQGTELDADDLILAKLTGLSVEALGQLEMGDYFAAHAALTGFLLRRVAGGPARKG